MIENQNKNKLISKKEVAEMLSLSERTIERLVLKGSLSCIKIGRSVRFRLPEIEEVLMGKRDLA